MPYPSQILSDPSFQALPLGEQLKVMRSVDEGFASLPLKDQGTVIAKSRQKSLGLDKVGEKKQDKGMANTLVGDALSIPGALMHPIDTATGLVGSQVDQFKKGAQDFKKGEYVSGAGHAAAGALPVLGPMAAQVGDEIGEGQYGQAAAHGLELALPEARRLPGGKVASAAGDAARTVAGKLPDLSPIQKFAVKKVPGMGTAVDIAEYLKGKKAKGPLAKPEPAAPQPKIVKPETYRARGERNPEDLGKLPGEGQPSRGPLQEPKAGVDASKPASAKSDASAIADVLKKIGTTREEAAKMSELEWKLVFSNAKLKALPDPKVLKAALAQLQ